MRKIHKLEKPYPNIPISIVALYWEGISINAVRENAASFLDRGTFFAIISEKFTNCRMMKLN